METLSPLLTGIKGTFSEFSFTMKKTPGVYGLLCPAKNRLFLDPVRPKVE